MACKSTSAGWAVGLLDVIVPTEDILNKIKPKNPNKESRTIQIIITIEISIKKMKI